MCTAKDIDDISLDKMGPFSTLMPLSEEIIQDVANQHLVKNNKFTKRKINRPPFFQEEELDDGNCPICLCRNVSCVISECGHMLCGSCSREESITQCPMCKKDVNNIIRVYLPH
jgi:hypothetical protein